MDIPWNAVGHAAVGGIIGASNAIALADSGNAQVVMYCHIISIVVAQLGASLGVWQVSQSMGVRRELKLLRGGGGSPPPAPEAKAA
jgi:hypothetical protein